MSFREDVFIIILVLPTLCLEAVVGAALHYSAPLRATSGPAAAACEAIDFAGLILLRDAFQDSSSKKNYKLVSILFDSATRSWAGLT